MTEAIKLGWISAHTGMKGGRGGGGGGREVINQKGQVWDRLGAARLGSTRLRLHWCILVGLQLGQKFQLTSPVARSLGLGLGQRLYPLSGCKVPRIG